MFRRRPRLGLLVAVAMSVLFVATAGPGAVAKADAPDVFATVGSVPAGAAMPGGFLGLSIEYSALPQYAGSDPRQLDPVFLNLVRGLSPGQAPVLRIGGNSTDITWWPQRGVLPPGGVSYPLTSRWLATARSLADRLHAKLILGVNLAQGSSALAATEARALLAGIGPSSVQALEIGNEPDLYTTVSWYRDYDGRAYRARGRGWGLAAFTQQFSRWRAALPRFPLAGPAASGASWMAGLDPFLSTQPSVSVVTFHRYPLIACVTNPDDPAYPTIDHLLADTSSSGLAAGVAPFVAVAHAHARQFRIGELNSVSCFGRRGVSDTFASALWMLDTLFNFAAVGVDGVNVHTLPGAAYELFTLSQPNGRWQAAVHPEYYAMLMFEQAFPPGARLLPVATAGSSAVKVWSTQGADGSLHTVLINKDPSAAHVVSIATPGTGGAILEWLKAPSVTSTAGVTLGGVSFGSATTTGRLPAVTALTPIFPAGGAFTITVPPASAALLTQ